MKWERTRTQPKRGKRRVDPDDLAPSAWRRMRELAWHFPRMLAGLGPLGPRGPEDGPPVLVIPGFLATDRTTMDLRRALARAGWRAHPWLLGLNTGAKADTLDLLGSGLGNSPIRARCWWSAGASAGCSRGSWRTAVRTRCGR